MHAHSVTRRFSSAMLGLFLAFPAMHASERDKKPDLTPLMSAAANGDLEAVHQLIAKGADVHQRTRKGETALYEAIDRRNPDKDNLPIVEALLTAGANANEVEVFDTSALVVSLTREYGNPEVTLLLIRSGARVPLSCGDGDSVVALATMSSSIEVLQALLGVGAPANCAGVHGQTALHWAALNAEVQRVEVLLEYGANPSQRDSEGRTPLDVVMTTNPDPIIQGLFEKTRELLIAAAQKAADAESLPAR